jgi:hypothetical protein
VTNPTDKTKVEAAAAPRPHLRLHASESPASLDRKAKRFDVFLIDTGWNRQVSRVVHKHLPVFFDERNPDQLFILSPDQSSTILRLAPELIGHDPTILVYDQYVPPAHRGRYKDKIYRGFRLNLGVIKRPEQALARLQDFVRFMLTHRQADHLHRAVTRELHREGFDGMVKILREASTELI